MYKPQKRKQTVERSNGEENRHRVNNRVDGIHQRGELGCFLGMIFSITSFALDIHRGGHRITKYCNINETPYWAKLVACIDTKNSPNQLQKRKNQPTCR